MRLVLLRVMPQRPARRYARRMKIIVSIGFDAFETDFIQALSFEDAVSFYLKGVSKY